MIARCHLLTKMQNEKILLYTMIVIIFLLKDEVVVHITKYIPAFLLLKFRRQFKHYRKLKQVKLVIPSLNWNFLSHICNKQKEDIQAATMLWFPTKKVRHLRHSKIFTLMNILCRAMCGKPCFFINWTWYLAISTSMGYTICSSLLDIK